MKRFIFSALVSLAAVSCAYNPYRLGLLDLNYTVFEPHCVEISPFDAPHGEYKLLGEKTLLISAYNVLKSYGAETKSKLSPDDYALFDAMIHAEVESRVTKFAQSKCADAVFRFKVETIEMGAMGTCKVSFVYARRLNPDGSYARELEPRVSYTSSIERKPDIVLDSTRCLAVIDGVQCTLKHTKRKPYCWRHVPYCVDGVFVEPKAEK